MKPSQWAGVLCCTLFSLGIAFGQFASTSLRGVVKDPSGAVVPGVTVSITDQGNGKVLTATTNSAGLYQFVQIVPSHYSVSVRAKGFAEQTKTAELLVDQPATINFSLSMKSESVSVDVSAEAQTLNVTDASMGSSVGNAMIQSLPMEGRDPASLLSLQPGVLYIGQTPSSADSRQGAVSGGRSDQGNVVLDGVDDNDQLNGTAFFGVLRSTLDSTEEFRVTTSNGTAEAGRSSGAQVNLVTKSGTNQYHGALYEYYRPTNTVANGFFNKNSELSAGSPNIPQKYVQNVFGGSIGAPIKKDKLFYFFNYEGKRQAVDDIVEATVPTASFLAGQLGYQSASGGTPYLNQSQIATLDQGCTLKANYFNGATVCPWGAGVNPNVISYYQNVPVATGSAEGDGINSGSLFFASHAPLTQNTSILKLDYDLNERNHIFARGNLQKDVSAGDANLPGQPGSSATEDNTKGFEVGHTWSPSSSIVNDIRYGFIRQGYGISGIGSGDYVDFRFLTQPTAQTRNTIQSVPLNTIVDTLTWSKSTHTIAVGGAWRGIHNNHSTNANSFSSASTNPYWLIQDYPSPSDLDPGFSNSWEIAYASIVGTVPSLTSVQNYKVTGPTSATLLSDGAFITRNFHSNEFEYYLQDTWHLRPNLTITYGLRHTILQTPYEANGQQVAPTIDTRDWFLQRGAAAAQGVVYEPSLTYQPNGKKNGAPGYWPKQKLNIAPRFSLAYSPNSKTSIRMGGGIYFDHYGEALVNAFDQEGSAGLSSSLNNAADSVGFESAPRFTGPHNLPAISLPAAPTTQSFPYTPPDLFAITWGLDNHLKTPYAEAFNLSFQHELPGGFVFEEAYVGRLGRHLLQQLDIAEPVNYNDPQGAGDYFTNATKLSKLVDLHGGCYYNQGSSSCGKTAPVYVPKIQYFEDVFPQLAGYDFQGESATEAIYNNEWAPIRLSGGGETSSLADLDFFCSYGCPNGSKFWQSQFSSLYTFSSIGTSSYNGLQLILRRPMSHGIAVDASYTFSKSIDMNSGTERANELGNGDNGFGGSAIQNSWNPKLNKAVSDFDTHSLLTTDWVYALPFGRGKALMAHSNLLVDSLLGGWQWAGLGRWTSGLPYSFFEPGWTTDWQLEGYAVQTGPVKFKKTFVKGLPLLFDTATQNTINNGARFGNPIRPPYPGEAGERNAFRGDGFFDIDTSLTKTWSLVEGMKLKFAGEVYNVSNTNRFDVSPANLNTGLTSGTLGSYGNTLSTYRRMQFGLRLDF